jgi:hypothetical protein
MSKQKVITEQDIHTNPTLAMAVNPDSELKKFLVEYAGNKLNPEKEEVTVNMIAEVLAIDFPEFAFAYAEENFLRGYKLGLEDAENLHTTETDTTDGTTD